MSKWEQLQQAYFLKPSICILIGLCFILLYLHKQIKKGVESIKIISCGAYFVAD